ncbi:MAG: DUF2490 domain-containing protein [Prolixibacteraceae bacterium]|jgi:hypothetical protein|nr:DUF2490 domain-containing protein [Prolixibacteraceae bacterium]
MRTQVRMTMMIRLQEILLLILLLFIATVISAQNYDTKLRLSGSIDKDITKKLKASFEYEHRFDTNISNFDKAFIEPEVEYEIMKDVDVGAKYRVGINQKKSGMTYQQRFTFYGNYEYDIEEFEVSVQSLLQYGYDDIENSSNMLENALVARYSISVDYDWFGTKMEPYFKYELHHHLNHPNGHILNEWKLRAGLKYDLTRKSRLNIFYMFENEFNVAKPVDAHILGIGYSYSL